MNPIPTAKVREVCRVQNGFAFDSSRFSKTSGTPLIRIRDLKTGSPSENYDGEFDRGYLVIPGDLLIGMDGEFKPYKWNGPEALLNQRVCRLFPVPERLDADFLRYAIESLLQKIEDETAFTTVKHLSSHDILDLDIPLPTLPDQRRIAAMLNKQMSELERIRGTVSQQSLEVERLAAAWFREAFRGVVPLAAWDADQSDAPNGWRWRSLGDIAQLESGHTPSRNRPDWWGGDIPWLALPDIRQLDGEVATQTTEHTNEQGIANSSARILPQGTVCLSRTASVGFVTILGRPMATSQDFVNWICGPELDSHFLMHLLRAARTYIRSLSSGAIHKTVYMPTLKVFRVCVPEVTEQRRIATRLSAQLRTLEAVRERVTQTANIVASLPNAILRRAFSGAM